MRLGKVRNTVAEVTNTSGQMVIEADAVYGGQAYTVKKFDKLSTALTVVSDQKWNDLDFSPVKTILDAYDKSATQTITNTEYDQINSYIASVNQKLPIFIGLIQTMVEDQDEQAINVKLPEKATNLKGLNALNTKLDKLFMKFNIDGKPIVFKGFDTGTDWYIFAVGGVITYRFIIGCIKIAHDYFDMRKTYFDSKRSKLDYEASLKANEKFDDKAFKEFQQRRLDLEVATSIDELIKHINEKNGHEVAELNNKLIIATKDLIEVLDEGAEFHLSLNPPKYVEEDSSGLLTINYSQMPKLETKKEVKTIESGKTKTTEDVVNE